MIPTFVSLDAGNNQGRTRAAKSKQLRLQQDKGKKEARTVTPFNAAAHYLPPGARAAKKRAAKRVTEASSPTSGELPSPQAPLSVPVKFRVLPQNQAPSRQKRDVGKAERAVSPASEVQDASTEPTTAIELHVTPVLSSDRENKPLNVQDSALARKRSRRTPSALPPKELRHSREDNNTQFPSPTLALTAKQQHLKNIQQHWDASPPVSPTNKPKNKNKSDTALSDSDRDNDRDSSVSSSSGGREGKRVRFQDDAEDAAATSMSRKPPHLSSSAVPVSDEEWLVMEAHQQWSSIIAHYRQLPLDSHLSRVGLLTCAQAHMACGCWQSAFRLYREARNESQGANNKRMVQNDNDDTTTNDNAHLPLLAPVFAALLSGESMDVIAETTLLLNEVEEKEKNNKGNDKHKHQYNGNQPVHAAEVQRKDANESESEQWFYPMLLVIRAYTLWCLHAQGGLIPYPSEGILQPLTLESGWIQVPEASLTSTASLAASGPPQITQDLQHLRESLTLPRGRRSSTFNVQLKSDCDTDTDRACKSVEGLLRYLKGDDQRPRAGWECHPLLAVVQCRLLLFLLPFLFPLPHQTANAASLAEKRNQELLGLWTCAQRLLACPVPASQKSPLHLGCLILLQRALGCMDPDHGPFSSHHVLQHEMLHLCGRLYRAEGQNLAALRCYQQLESCPQGLALTEALTVGIRKGEIEEVMESWVDAGISYTAVVEQAPVSFHAGMAHAGLGRIARMREAWMLARQHFQRAWQFGYKLQNDCAHIALASFHTPTLREAGTDAFSLQQCALRSIASSQKQWPDTLPGMSEFRAFWLGIEG